MQNEKLIKHWAESSDSDFEAMLSNYSAKYYNWALFIGHLVLEKLFKALFLKTNPNEPQAPLIHNLVTLAKLCNIQPTNEILQMLGEINSFNIGARYETEKRAFYVRCTKEYAQQWIEYIKEIREWLRKELTQE